MGGRRLLFLLFLARPDELLSRPNVPGFAATRPKSVSKAWPMTPRARLWSMTSSSSSSDGFSPRRSLALAPASARLCACRRSGARSMMSSYDGDAGGFDGRGAERPSRPKRPKRKGGGASGESYIEREERKAAKKWASMETKKKEHSAARAAAAEARMKKRSRSRPGGAGGARGAGGAASDSSEPGGVFGGSRGSSRRTTVASVASARRFRVADIRSCTFVGGFGDEVSRSGSVSQCCIREAKQHHASCLFSHKCE